MKPAAHQYEDKLLELAYGELPAPEASAVESHVRTCARCTDALAEIRSVRNTMGQLPMEPVPDAGLESLLAYADQAARRNAAGPAPVATWWRKLMAPLAAAGALSLIGIVAYQTNKEAPPTASPADIAERSNREQKSALKSETITAAPAPAPVAAAEPPAAPGEAPPAAEALAWDQKEAEKAQLEERQLAPAKVAAPKPAAKKMAGPSLGDDLQHAKVASAKNEEKAAKRKADTSGYADDYSNAVQRGAQPAADKGQVAVDEITPKGGEAYGLTGGANVRQAPAQQNAPQAPPPPPMQAQAAPTESRTSLGVGIGQQQRRDREQQEGRFEDAPAVAAAQKPKDLVANLDAKTKEMKQNEYDRNTKTQLEIAMELLRAAPARSPQRLQALDSVCRGLRALEKIDEAQPYCQALLTEYPNSKEAIAYAQTLHQIQRPAAAKRSKAYDADEAKQPAAPAPAKKAAEPSNATSY